MKREYELNFINVDKKKIYNFLKFNFNYFFSYNINLMYSFITYIFNGENS